LSRFEFKLDSIFRWST